MTQQRDPNADLRAAFALRAIDRAKRDIQTETGPIGVFMRVALAIIFMYLIVISYMMMGAAGPVFISVLSLVAFFVPYLYQAVKNLMERRRVQKADRLPGRGSPQEG